MNGHSNDIDYAPMPDDDEEMYVAMRYDEWLAGWLAAHSVDLAAGGPDAGDLAEHDDREHTDAYMFDRSLRNIGGMSR